MTAPPRPRIKREERKKKDERTNIVQVLCRFFSFSFYLISGVVNIIFTFRLKTLPFFSADWLFADLVLLPFFSADWLFADLVLFLSS